MSNDYYTKELRLTHHNMKQDNCLRILKTNEIKRRTILEKHKLLKEWNDKKKSNITLIQNCAINRSLTEQETRKLIFKLMEKLTMEDPYKSKQRKCLLKTIEKLNSKFELGIDINGRMHKTNDHK